MSLLICILFLAGTVAQSAPITPEAPAARDKNVAVANVPARPPDPPGYTLGIDDVLSITVLQPEQFGNIVTVSPDGTLSFPYVGHIMAKGKTIEEVQEEIQKRLSNGYFRYPSVIVLLKQSRSRRFFVYGEVNKPGPYPLESNVTVLRAISMAGGFTRFGSASRVKVLRPKEGRSGYELMQVNIKAVMSGDSSADLELKSGDIMIISEGIL